MEWYGLCARLYPNRWIKNGKDLATGGIYQVVVRSVMDFLRSVCQSDEDIGPLVLPDFRVRQRLGVRRVSG